MAQRSKDKAKSAADRSAKARRGRATPPAETSKASGRYTPPTPRSVRRSPHWYPWMLLMLLVIGVLAIILNYVQVLPNSPTNWYTLAGLLSIVLGALAATRYR